MDLDFSNVLRFPPEQTAGIAVLKPSREMSLSALHALAKQLVALVARQSIDGKLWIVESGRIRVHEAENDG